MGAQDPLGPLGPEDANCTDGWLRFEHAVKPEPRGKSYGILLEIVEHMGYELGRVANHWESQMCLKELGSRPVWKAFV